MSSPSSPAPTELPAGASPERFAPVPGGVEICYQTFGDPTG